MKMFITIKNVPYHGNGQLVPPQDFEEIRDNEGHLDFRTYYGNIDSNQTCKFSFVLRRLFYNTKAELIDFEEDWKKFVGNNPSFKEQETKYRKQGYSIYATERKYNGEYSIISIKNFFENEIYRINNAEVDDFTECANFKRLLQFFQNNQIDRKSAENIAIIDADYNTMAEIIVEIPAL